MLFGKHVNRYYIKYFLFFVIGIIALLAVDVVQLQVPELLGGLIDHIDKNTLNINILNDTIKTLASIILVLFLGRFLWRFAFFGLSERLEADLRRRMFIKIESLGQDYFSDNKTGSIMALMTNDLSAIKNCFGHGTMMLVDAAFLGVLTFSKMLKMQPMLALAAIIPLSLMSLIGVFVSKQMNSKFKKRQEAYEKMSDFTQENFSGLSVVRAYVKEINELKRFRKINKHNEKTNLEFIKFHIRLDILLTLFINSIVLFILALGAYFIINSEDGSFTIGNLTTYISYFSTLVWPMMAVTQLISMSAQGYASLGRVNKLMNEVPSVKDSKDVLDVKELKGKIEFRNLDFTYPGLDYNILTDVSFVVNPGEKIGIIGRTGSGKTTIVDLILRMYNVEENKVFIDDLDIMKIPLKTIRTNISFVPQDNFLFGTKVKDNIAFKEDNLDEISIERIHEVASLADVKKDIDDFTDGFDTILGERGVTVSGGQKQRISIARALLKKSNILILDDAVSAVDTKTEDTILKNLKNHYSDVTVLITAHRISTVQDMDKILVLDEGRVAGFGTHDELYANNSLYKEMVDLQKLEAKIEGEQDGRK